MANLYIIATPIGNLGDITLRAIETLKRVDFVLCEDTRISQKLLNHLGIKKPIISYHHHSGAFKEEMIIGLLKQGKHGALISDAGTPGISDPGNKLIHQILKMWESDPPPFFSATSTDEFRVITVPGPSAITAIASVCGFSTDKFLFLGFPPHKKGRNKFFKEIIDSKYPVIFFESPHRIIKSLSELMSLVNSHKLLVNVVVGRELTKKFETIYRGSIGEVIKQIEKDKIKGEFVVVIEGKK